MQRRDFIVVRSNGDGEPEAQVKAQSLAGFSDAEFIEAIVHVKAMLDRIGGQVQIAALREKLDKDGQRVEKDDPSGVYQTLGYVFRYEPHSRLRQAPEEPDARKDEPPEEPDFADLTPAPLQFGDDLDDEDFPDPDLEDAVDADDAVPAEVS
jgi:hypothetical protein